MTTNQIQNKPRALALLSGGIFVLVFGALILSIPIIAFINHKERRDNY